MAWKRVTRTCTVFGLLALGACGDSGKKEPHQPPDGGEDGGQSHTSDAGERDAGAQARADAGRAHDAGASADAAVNLGDAQVGGFEASPHWFADKTPLELSISAPLGDAFRAAFAGVPDGIVPPNRKKDPFAGSLALDGKAARDVELAVRGNSSLQECSFPKLKLNFGERIKDEIDTFFATKKIKLGTHCGEEAETNGTIGRLRSELATFREEVVYQLARALDMTIMQTRPAIVTYTDTSSEPEFAGKLTRKGFLLEHVDELARRLGATALQDPVSCGDDPNLLPHDQDVLRVKFFHAMIGNWDYAVGPPDMHGCGPLWNTEVLVHPEGYLTLVPADFDLSAFVVAEVRDPESNQLVAIDAENAKASARAYLAGATMGESSEAVAAMKAEYMAKKATLLALVHDSLMDEDGKKSATLLLEGFFAVLAESRE
jgi:hypothetical protein